MPHSIVRTYARHVQPLRLQAPETRKLSAAVIPMPPRSCVIDPIDRPWSCIFFRSRWSNDVQNHPDLSKLPRKVTRQILRKVGANLAFN